MPITQANETETIPEVELPISKPMVTLRQKLWLFMTSDAYVREVMKLNPRKLDSVNLEEEEFSPIGAHWRTTIPMASTFIAKRTKEGSIWVMNRKQLNAVTDKIADDQFPVRICYYKE